MPRILLANREECKCPGGAMYTPQTQTSPHCRLNVRITLMVTLKAWSRLC